MLLLRGVVGRVGEKRLSWPEAWRLTLAGVAASRLLAAAGAGGIALTGWALARMGMSAHTVATRLATFFLLLYAVFMGALVVAGFGLSVGWLAGPAPFGLTVVPALFAASVIVAALALALVPPRFGRVRGHAQRPGEGRGKRIADASRRRRRPSGVACAAPKRSFALVTRRWPERSSGGRATCSCCGPPCMRSARRRRRGCWS